MFIGHYGVSLAAKRFAPQVSLGTLFLGAQFLDLLFCTFVLAGIEHLRIVPGFTKTNPFDLYAMQYSHSLVGAVLWSAVGALAFALLSAKRIPAPKVRVAAALIVAVVVFSHFLLDLPMHTADMPLGFDADSQKIGLGLWNQPDVSIAMELGALVAGGALYLGATRPLEGGLAATRVTGLVLVALAIGEPFVPSPETPVGFAVEALVAYVVLAGLAEWMDRKRAATTPQI